MPISWDHGDAKIGNLSTGDIVRIRNSDGNFTLEGNATAWDDLRFPAAGVNPAGAEAPPVVDSTAFLGTLLFSASAVNVIAGQAQMPHHWREGSKIYPHVHWAPTSTNTGSVLWRFSYDVADVNGTFAGSYTDLDVLDAGDGTTNKHQIAAFDGIDMTGRTLSSMLIWKLQRVGDNSTDTYTGTARLLEMDFHYEVDSFGSVEEYTKQLP